MCIVNYINVYIVHVQYEHWWMKYLRIALEDLEFLVVMKKIPVLSSFTYSTFLSQEFR